MTETKLGWKVHTHALFREILNENAALVIPLNILQNILVQVAQRATELNDPKLNALMIRLTLYSVANPLEPDYNPELVSKILGETIEFEKGE